MIVLNLGWDVNLIGRTFHSVPTYCWRISILCVIYYLPFHWRPSLTGVFPLCASVSVGGSVLVAPTRSFCCPISLAQSSRWTVLLSFHFPSGEQSCILEGKPIPVRVRFTGAQLQLHPTLSWGRV